VGVPPFAVQTMVENSIKHGIAPRLEPSTLRIITQGRCGKAIVAVLDDGLGMNAQTRQQILTFSNDDIQHGLQLLTRQLELLHGRNARVRLFSEPDRGTLVVFAVPNPPELQMQ